MKRNGKDCVHESFFQNTNADICLLIECIVPSHKLELLNRYVMVQCISIIMKDNPIYVIHVKSIFAISEILYGCGVFYV